MARAKKTEVEAVLAHTNCGNKFEEIERACEQIRERGRKREREGERRRERERNRVGEGEKALETYTRAHTPCLLCSPSHPVTRAHTYTHTRTLGG